MPFCTKCGAQVGGNFCNHCGTPAAQAGAQPAMQPMPDASPRRGMHPLVLILLIIFGLFALGIFGAVGTVFWAARNPARAIRTVMAHNPNVEVLNMDEGSSTVTIRDRRTGKVVTLSFDDARHGRFHMTADDGEGRTAEFQVGGDAHPPSWIPDYPGSHPHGLFSATGDSGSEAGDAGSFTFTTPDSAAKVTSFYEDHARNQDMRIRTNAVIGRTGTLATFDEMKERGFKVIAIESRGETTVTVTYGRKI